MRYRRVRRDANHTAIVTALKQAGCSVLDLAAVGGGCPDVLAANAQRTVLLEIKMPGFGAGKKNGTRFRATADKQAKFRAQWRGPITAVESVEAALEAMGVLVFRS